jgi:hypothetical protein
MSRLLISCEIKCAISIRASLGRLGSRLDPTGRDGGLSLIANAIASPVDIVRPCSYAASNGSCLMYMCQTHGAFATPAHAKPEAAVRLQSSPLLLIVVQAGTHTDTLSLKYADFARLVNPSVAEFARYPSRTL